MASFKISIAGNTVLTDSDDVQITEPAVLKRFSGIADNEEPSFSDYLLDGVEQQCLEDAEIHGGHLILSYRKSDNQLTVVTEYFASRRLTKGELEILRAYTVGQWSDGFGEGFAPPEIEDRGWEIDLTPEGQSIHARQTESKERRVPVRSPLVKPIEAGNTRKVADFIASGEDVNFRDNFGISLLHVAVKSRNIDIVKQLLDAGADVHARCKDVSLRENEGESVIHYAAMFGGCEVLAELLERGASADSPDGDGFTPLMLAANRGHRDAVELLLNADCNVNHQCEGGHTALIMADKHVGVLQLLLDHGADVMLAGAMVGGLPDMNPLEQARRKLRQGDPYEEVVELLSKYAGQ